jgi:hypothetical protein
MAHQLSVFSATDATCGYGRGGYRGVLPEDYRAIEKIMVPSLTVFCDYPCYLECISSDEYLMRALQLLRVSLIRWIENVSTCKSNQHPACEYYRASAETSLRNEIPSSIYDKRLSHTLMILRNCISTLFNGFLSRR